ncbi:Glutamate receptor ionotropic, delta-1 [Frankliniella fusca]|uniref:Glutamate receptor ionotropic, delta-1 n=1 Tax=Frankliniella fusca TaxID=407009 RepID=A0AAE1LJK0_9NEOP|nr:Glutamate receptor ionotropic, delta-1 [Frankliniella fusca]
MEAGERSSESDGWKGDDAWAEAEAVPHSRPSTPSATMLRGALVVLAFMAAGAAGTTRPRHPDDTLDLLADFLALQAATIAPSYLSGVSCTWGAAAVIGSLSRRGLTAYVVDAGGAGTTNTTPGTSAMTPAPARPGAPGAPGPGTANNPLYQPRVAPSKQAAGPGPGPGPSPAGLLALPEVQALLGALHARGQPGRDGEPSLAEEVFLDMACPGADQLLHAASAGNLFRRPFRWVLLAGGGGGGCPPDLEAYTPRAALVDSQVTVLCPGRAVEVHRSGLGGPAAARAVAERSGPGPGGHLRLLQLRRGDIERDMQGLIVRTGIALLDSNDSIHHLTDGREKQFDQLTKTTFTILLQAYELMNATISLHVTNSHGYIRNGTYDGLLGDLFNGLVETGATVMLPVAFRMLAITYSGFSIPMRAVTVFRQPPLAYTDNVFWLPFPDSLWAAALSLVALCCVLAMVALHLEPSGADPGAQPAEPQRSQGAGRGGPKQPLRASLSDVFLLAFGAIAQQGGEEEEAPPEW